MIRDLIIDGYNLMHAAGFARRKYGPGGLERSRNRLLARLAELLTGAERQRTTVVFDAKEAPAGRSDADVRSGLCILFARDTDEADDLIERLIAQHSAPKQLLVVSSDHRLHRAARRRKASACDSDRFLDRLEKRVARADEPSATAENADETETELSADEMQHWLNEFSDVDVDQIRREVSPKPKATASPETARDKPAGEPKAKIPEVDADELAMWEDRLSDLLGHQDGKTHGKQG